MPDGYLVTAETIRKLRRDHDELRTQLKVLQNSILRGPATSVAGTAETLALAKLSENIDGYDTNGAGNAVLDNGQADIYTLKPDGELVSLDRSVEVYNGEVDDLTSGTYVSIQRHYLTGKWIIDRIGAGGTELHRVQLTEDMGNTTTQEAAADLLTLAGVDTGTDVTVLDPDDKYKYALGPATYTYSADSDQNELLGARGYAILSGGDYHLIECETVARMIRFMVEDVAGYTTCDDTFSATPRHNGWMDGQNPGPRTITNPDTHCPGDSSNIFEGDYGDYGFARWSDVTGVYYCIQMECPDITCEVC